MFGCVEDELVELDEVGVDVVLSFVVVGEIDFGLVVD